MFAKIPVLLVVGVALASPQPAGAQTPSNQTPAPPAAPPSAETFPPGAEVLSVDGEALGRLADVETSPGGERLLHIRRADGSITTAPAIVASRGERAVVLDWTRAEFESGAGVAPTGPVPKPPPL